ncbi:zinc ion transmembrane transporter [Aureococcus anophagefferens]|nr:zinc ion transmembrane transporter [Aureococcus anophagefferens]
MQVAFDSTYVRFEEELDKSRKAREEKKRELLSSEEKRLQLEELARIVTGIRLFNREGGKGGAGLDHVEDAVATTVSDLRDALDAETAEQHDLALRYQETLVYCHLRQPPGVAPAQLERWAQELANRRQYGAYLTSLAEDAAASARRVQVHRERFATEMDELQALVGGRASVPKEHVYPKFDAIATAWFAPTTSCGPALEYQGFCGWTVANRHGLLLPGAGARRRQVPRVLLRLRRRAVALKAFMDAPEAVREGVVAQATLAPELVHLLRLQDSYPGTSIAKILASRAITGKGAEPGQATAVAKALLAPAATRDASTDTPVHFVEKHIDPAYEWNDWALRRRALRLAQLKHCATTSQQTDESHFRRNNTTQVFLPKIASTQSRKDGETNPPVRIRTSAARPNKIVNPEEKPLRQP